MPKAIDVTGRMRAEPRPALSRRDAKLNAYQVSHDSAPADNPDTEQRDAWIWVTKYGPGSSLIV